MQLSLYGKLFLKLSLLLDFNMYIYIRFSSWTRTKFYQGGGTILIGGGKWGQRGREVGAEGEGSGDKGGGKWWSGTPLSTPSGLVSPVTELSLCSNLLYHLYKAVFFVALFPKVVFNISNVSCLDFLFATQSLIADHCSRAAILLIPIICVLRFCSASNDVKIGITLVSLR